MWGVLLLGLNLLRALTENTDFVPQKVRREEGTAWESGRLGCAGRETAGYPEHTPQTPGVVCRPYNLHRAEEEGDREKEVRVTMCARKTGRRPRRDPR